ncbi:DNA-formamidopyrimidine glycosylase [Alkalibacterium sp. 20]|uniref:DNA-formamidopyrimidine glycosylase n=1 Tax=Alkalibacterium sp. 20 TaxID=1798803 RepID=UPI00090042F9|nr:DNA-formamidopyrimidine glycosylase [Alkalibacterium sp. 20]OJF95753.1 5-hydroxymethyluracil DNA glycosylase [Alkalibacterium sp. 20]
MPELPEVENVKNGLKNLVLGKIIIDTRVLWSNIIKEPSVFEFQKKLRGQEIIDIKRQGKFLLFILTDYVLISHLRMEGKYRIEKATRPLTKHTHVVFELNSDEQLRYLDVRKFGKMSLVDKDKLHLHPSIKNLGPEPTVETLRTEHLIKALKKTERPIKACLLDQKTVAGIGNIYADEILYDAYIHPERKGSALSSDEIEKLKNSIIGIMSKAVEKGGTTIRTYSNAFGVEGSYQSYLKVYGKKDETCQRCHHTIEKIKVAQRGTHYCPHCQKIGR